MQQEEHAAPTSPPTTIASLYMDFGFTPYSVDLFARVPHGITDRMICGEPVCRKHAEEVLRVISGWAKEVLTLELVNVALLDEEESHELPTFADILSQFRTDARFHINNLPSLLGFPLETIMLMVSNKPVLKADAEAILSGFSLATHVNYTLETLHVHLEPEKKDTP
jgi:hypothetical protein